MGGKNDKRSHKGGIRADDNRDNYLDSIVDNSADYLTPYIDNLVILTNGNHETAILRHQETDLLHRLTTQLGIYHGGYSGFIRFMFEAITTNGHKGNRTTRRLYYHHGSGGGGPVTKGVIQANRRASSVDADIFVSGHIHEAWVVENMMVKCTDAGKIYLATQTHVQLPTYKQEYKASGYHIEKGRPAKPLGGYWLTFHYDSTQTGNVGYRIDRAN